MRLSKFQFDPTPQGRTVACFSHAASVALVAAFLHPQPVGDLRKLKFHPCGVFELRKVDAGPVPRSTWL